MTVSKWPMFLRQCLLQRTSGEEFAELLTVMYERSKTSGATMIHVLLKCKTSFCAPNDPLIAIYLQKILSLALADVPDLLHVLAKQWNEFSKAAEAHSQELRPIEDAASIVNSLIGMIAINSFILSPKEAGRSLVLCSRWLASVATWVSKDPARASDISSMAFVESCGMLLVAIASSNVGIALLDQSKSINSAEQLELVASIQKAIYSSLPLLPTASQSLHLRLEAVLRHVSQPRANDDNDASTQGALHFQSRVIDGPSLTSRASLYLYLDTLRCRCATVDDSRLLSFLNARHSTDHAAMFVDLVVASFDILQRSHSRERNRQSLDRWCSFVVNKLPSLLSIISASSFGSFSTEESLKSALQFVNTEFSSQFLTTTLSVVKIKFVQVCASHRLLPSSNVSLVVGTPELDLSHSSSLYAKDDLVSQMKSSQSKAAKLLKDIGCLDGNASNIASAVVEVVHGYCQSKETLPLKELASAMLRKPELIDLVSMYVQSGHFLGSLCRLLDEWAWDDLHGEGQPLYEEFGNILLLITAIKERLSLTESEIALSSGSTFVYSFLHGTNGEHFMETMAEDAKKHLGEWINALFIAEGLSDEVMSSCSPQDFYRLVPTILSQSLTACESGMLSIETLRSGFEYFLEPFLLPSLIIAIPWLMSPAAARHNQQYVQQLLETFLKEPGLIEAREIHHTVLGIVAAKLGVSGGDSSSQSASDLLGKYVGFASPISADLQEVRSWSAMQGGVMAQVEQAIHGLVSWASTNTHLMAPPTSGYAKLAAALEIYDAKFVLKRLSQMVLGYYNSMEHAAVLDLIATSVICLDESLSVKRLADALSLEQQNLLLLLKNNETLLAEEIVRLSRCVERLSVVVAITNIPMDDVVTTLIPELTEADMQNIQAFPDHGTEMPVTQDDAHDIDQMLDAAAAMGEMEQENNHLESNVDEMYLDLDPSDMDLVNFEDMDMEGMF